MSSAVEPSSASVHATTQGSNLWREVAIVAFYELKGLALGLRSILFLVIYGGVAAACGAFYLWAAGQIEAKLIEANPALASLDRKAMITQFAESDEFREQLGPAITWLGGETLLQAVLRGEMPWVVLFVLLLSTFVLPPLVLIVGYDRISEDLSSKYCRFVLQRVRRGSYLAGKILGQWATVFAAVLVVHLVLIAVGAAVSPGFETEQVLAAMPKLWVGMALFLLAYVSFVALFSSLLTPPFAALALGGIALMALWFLSTFTPLRSVWMGTWDMGLWVLDPAAAGVYLAHVLGLGAISWAVLSRRDV